MGHQLCQGILSFCFYLYLNWTKTHRRVGQHPTWGLEKLSSACGWQENHIQENVMLQGKERSERGNHHNHELALVSALWLMMRNFYHGSRIILSWHRDVSIPCWQDTGRRRRWNLRSAVILWSRRRRRRSNRCEAAAQNHRPEPWHCRRSTHFVSLLQLPRDQTEELPLWCERERDNEGRRREASPTPLTAQQLCKN